MSTCLMPSTACEFSAYNNTALYKLEKRIKGLNIKRCTLLITQNNDWSKVRLLHFRHITSTFLVLFA